MINGFECVSCKKEVDSESFGIFVSITPTVQIDLGLKEKMRLKEFEGLMQFKVCEDCKKKTSVHIDYYEELEKSRFKRLK